MAAWLPRRSRCSLPALALLAVLPLTACGGGGGGGNGGGSTAIVTPPMPSPTPSPTPTPSQYRATDGPFQLTQSRDLDVFGWDSWPSAPAPSTIQIRWDAVGVGYEMMASVFAERGFLKALASAQRTYDVLTASGAKLPFTVILEAPDSSGFPLRHVGDARIFGASALAFVAFGIATAPGDLPSTGLRVCSFGMDEIGSGDLTVNLATGAVSGSVEPFNAPAGSSSPKLPIQATYSPGTTLSAAYGTDAANGLDARFFGPQAAEIAVRAKGAISGIMLGTCHA
jgi:hypothetical protein